MRPRIFSTITPLPLCTKAEISPVVATSIILCRPPIRGNRNANAGSF